MSRMSDAHCPGTSENFCTNLISPETRLTGYFFYSQYSCHRIGCILQYYGVGRKLDAAVRGLCAKVHHICVCYGRVMVSAHACPKLTFGRK